MSRGTRRQRRGGGHEHHDLPVDTLRWRMVLAVALSALRESREADRRRARTLEAGGQEPLRPAHQHLQGDLPAHRVAADVRLLDAHLVHERQHVGRHVRVQHPLAARQAVRIVALGTVFRKDEDATHSPMFTQIEGLAVDEGISFADLKGTLIHFVSRFFQRDLTIRLRPSYFPFVEPALEVDMRFLDKKGAGKWLEVGGCGMVHPNVLKNVGIDPKDWSGFAFGFGVERLIMIRHGITDLRSFYEGDVRFLEQF